MKTRWLVLVMFLLPATGAGYMTWLSWQAGDDGPWFFGVMAVFFLLMSLTPFVPVRKRQPVAKPPDLSTTRFVPHWFMLLALGIVCAIVVLALVNALFSR